MTRKSEPKQNIRKGQLDQLREMLRMSKDLNHAVFDHSPIGISIRDHSGKLLFVNKAWKKIWKLNDRQIKKNERISKNWSFKRRYPYLKKYTSRVERVFKKGGHLFIPEIKVDSYLLGTSRWISQNFYATRDSSGKVERIIILTQNITDHKIAEAALRESDIRFRTIFENVNVGVFRTSGDPTGRFVQINPALVKIFGYKSTQELIRKRVLDLYHNQQDRRVLLKELQQKGTVHNREILMKRKSGNPIWVSLYAKAHFNEQGKVQWIDGVIEDITDRKQKEEQLRALSLVDDLTGLYNRRGFITLAEHQLKIAQQVNNDIVLLYIDLDNLKAINDEYGHLFGDQALKETTTILKHTFRGSDIIARIGGDEFVVLTSETAANRAQSLYIRLKTNLDAFNQTAKLPFRLDLSIGWAHHTSKKPKTINRLLIFADRSMYRHKQSKKKHIIR